MFSVIFEVHPRSEHWDTYLGLGKMLRPEIEQIDGLVDNIRYRSLTRDGCILSLSGWRDEKALVRWRTQAKHHGAQESGRRKVLADYRLRGGGAGHAHAGDLPKAAAGQSRGQRKQFHWRAPEASSARLSGRSYMRYAPW